MTPPWPFSMTSSACPDESPALNAPSFSHVRQPDLGLLQLQEGLQLELLCLWANLTISDY